ncbi:antA/AntB antirepressor family protein [Bartonella sp. CB74]|uniref:antA/AntB antirepressor family protein n=1 Tax=Bartonella sp. CB74 TaxID=3113620 RepID=UPI002F96BC27
MNTLIPISEEVIDQETVQTVNARELHAFLEVGRDFTTWIKNRIKTYKFVSKRDYILTFPKTGERQNVSMTEYRLTLDMAKELAMVERNEKGRKARQYFIECEKKLKSQSVDCDRDTRFDLPHYWDEMRPAEKALYLLGPIHARLVEAFRLEEENKSYKALIAEAKRVLENPIKKVA